MLLEKNENRRNPKVNKKSKGNSTNKQKKVHKENNGHHNQPKIQKIQKSEILQNLSPQKILFISETNKIKNGNLKNILTNELLKSPKNFRQEFLKNQKISLEIRARMVN